MGALVVVVVALGASSLALLRWAAEDYTRLGRLSPGAAAAAWALGLMHAALVAVSAAAGLLRVTVPAAPAIGVGGLIGVAGAVLLGRGLAEFGTLDEVLGRRNGPLRTRGAYAICRHPQALGWGMLLTGGGLAGRSLAALLLVVPYWALLLPYLPLEERHLRALYGERYRDYTRRVPRLVRRGISDA